MITAKELKNQSNGGLEISPKLPNSCGNASSNVQLQDIKEEDNSKEDLLLPPLPCATEKSGNDPFDLSKALEIPCSVSSRDNNSCNGGINSNNSNSNANGIKENTESSAPLASPRISLKKKFSNALLNTGESSPVPFPDDSSPLSEYDANSMTRPVIGLRSQSSSNANSFQHVLPTLNKTVDDGSVEASNSSYNTTNSETQLPYYFESRRPLRKFSTGSSSNSSHSNTSITEDLFYKIPPPRMSFNSRSRSRSNSNSNWISTSLSLDNGGTTPTTVMNTPNSSSNNIYTRDLDAKKMPLLRRASSAIMRKNSKRSIITTGPGGNGVGIVGNGAGSNSASSTPILQSSAFFELADANQRTPPIDRVFRNSTDGMGQLPSEQPSLMDGDDDNMNYVTKLGRSTSRNPSIGSRVKRGFSKIMNGSGSVKRAASSSSLRSDYKFTPQSQQQFQAQTQAQQPFENELSKGGNGLPRSSLAGVLDSGVDNINENTSGNVTPISASTAMSPRSNYWSRNFPNSFNQFGETQQPTMGLGMEWKSSSFQQPRILDSTKSDITVDLDKLTKTIPIITVTDDLRSKGCTPIQVQSNISLDEIFTRNDAGARSGNSKHAHHDSNTSNNDEFTNTNNGNKKPEMMSLTDYIHVLVKQQQVEDERLAILEKSFKDSGWCSKDDLKNLRHKRVIISKKWAERISHYQSRLDS